MKQFVDRGQQWFAGRKRREQIIISGLSVLLLAWLGFIVLIEPAQIRSEESQRELRQIATSVNQLEQQVEELRQEAARDLNAPLETRERQLEARYRQVQTRVEELAVFIHPDQLLNWIQVLLASEEGLSLTSFDAKAPELFMEDSTGEIASVYQHEVTISLEGSYFEMRSYLERLQQARFQFYWRELDYQVTDYPKAQASMRLYVLSQAGRN